MNTYIVTGTTRGIGRALAEAILEDGHQLFTLSSASDSVDGSWINVACDFRRADTVIPCLKKLLAAGIDPSAQALVLINNAGVLIPIGPLGNIPEDQIPQHLAVNQVAPFLLMSAFIRFTQDFSGERRIINLSSGAARHPYAGWGLYCASKAALEMMTLCVASEQMGKENPVGVCAVSPGKVETDMQETIRGSDPARFPAQPKFVEAKASGDLLTPQAVARMIQDLDMGGQFQNSGIYDLRHAINQGGVLRIEPISTVM